LSVDNWWEIKMLRKTALFLSIFFLSFGTLAQNIILDGTFVKKNFAEQAGQLFYLDTGGKCNQLNDIASMKQNLKCISLNLSRLEKVGGEELSVSKFQETLNSLEGKPVKITGETLAGHFSVKEINFKIDN
jgi:hypothetical protein